MAMAYEIVLLDADDTLFDYPAAERNAFERLCAALSINDVDLALEVYKRINLECWAAYQRGEMTQEYLKLARFERWMAKLGLQPGEAAIPQARVVSEIYLDALSRESRLLPGALELVMALSQFARLAIVTNGIAMVQKRRLAISPIAPYIERLIISEEVGAQKPDRRIFDHALRLMGHKSPEGVLMVGDSLSSDIAGGNGAGIDTCFIDNPMGTERGGEAKPTYRVTNLMDVLIIAKEGIRA